MSDGYQWNTSWTATEPGKSQDNEIWNENGEWTVRGIDGQIKAGPFADHASAVMARDEMTGEKTPANWDEYWRGVQR